MRLACVFIACLLAGCSSPIVPVVGERVFVVREASTVDLPAPVAPAKIWYVVDDVCLKEWLGLETAIGHSTSGRVESVEVRIAR